MNGNEVSKTRDELLKELNSFVDSSSGRKRRSDKGKRRHVYNSPMYQSKMHVYNKIHSRLVNRDNDLRRDNDSPDSQLTLELDENGFYIPIQESYKTISNYYDQHYKGRVLHHTVSRRRVQKAIDLEKYRFEAWQEMAVLHPTEIVKPFKDLRQLLYHRYNFVGTLEEVDEAIENREVDWLTLFCEMYFVKPQDVSMWDYETWREYYNLCPVGQLPDDFEFILGVKPGSEYCHPEWEYVATRKAQQEKDQEETEKQRKSEQYISNMRRKNL